MAYIDRVAYLSEEKYNELVASGEASDNTLYIVPNAMFPVGFVYISTVDKSPALLFGGTWEKIEGRFLLSASSAYTAGSTGGEEEHTLTIEEMPNHNHAIGTGAEGIIEDGRTVQRGYGSDTYISVKTVDDASMSWVGGSLPHNNMPPYLAVYMWKRIA